jgi:hypothetical protein
MSALQSQFIVFCMIIFRGYIFQRCSTYWKIWLFPDHNNEFKSHFKHMGIKWLLRPSFRSLAITLPSRY